MNKNDRSTLFLWMFILVAMLFMQGAMMSKQSAASQGSNTVPVDYSAIESVYSREDAESDIFKAELASYKSDIFSIINTKDENKTTSKYKIITKTVTGEFKILDVNNTAISINIVPNIESPYVELRFSGTKSVDNVLSADLFLPDKYSIDVYTSQDSVNYNITEYKDIK